VAVWSIEAKAQQGGAWTEGPKGVAREGGEQREVWLNVRVEKMDTHKGVSVKVLLDSSVIGMFMDWKMTARHGFRLQKLKRPIVVRNVDRTNNSAGAITHQVEVNVYYKDHIERIRMDVCNLGRTDVILGML